MSADTRWLLSDTAPSPARLRIDPNAAYPDGFVPALTPLRKIGVGEDGSEVWEAFEPAGDEEPPAYLFNDMPTEGS